MVQISHLTEMGVRILPLFRAALCYQSSYAQPTPIPTPRFGSDGGWGLTMWMWVRCKKRTLLLLMGLAAAHRSWYSRRRIGHLPFLDVDMSIRTCYRLGTRELVTDEIEMNEIPSVQDVRADKRRHTELKQLRRLRERMATKKIHA